MEQQEIERASALCAAAGAWLVLDNTYEHFAYEGRQHFCLTAPHVINIFSFSKVRPAACLLHLLSHDSAKALGVSLRKRYDRCFCFPGIRAHCASTTSPHCSNPIVFNVPIPRIYHAGAGSWHDGLARGLHCIS